jgi:hypothetical protein
MKTKPILLILMLAMGFGLAFSMANAKDGSLPPRLLADAGKTFSGPQDPGFVSYDQVLRDYLIARIKKQYGVALDPKTYSGFELLEIEAFLKCKKSGEPLELFLSTFKKR